MDAPKLGWSGRLFLLANSHSSRLARDRTAELRTVLDHEQYSLLEKHAALAVSAVSTAQIPDALVNLFFSSEAMLSHPLLIHYIRPAIRMAAAAKYNILGIPVITNPALTFGGQAVPLGPSGFKVAEIPLGVVFLLREIGRGIVNLHNAIQYNEPDKVRLFAQVCSFLSALIYKDPRIVFNLGQKLFRRTALSYKIFSAQASQVLAVFLILHEIGHICKNHQLTRVSDVQRREQEHDADIFAMNCEFAPKKGEVRFEPFRKLQMIYICNLLSLMERELVMSGFPLNGYPSFKDRRTILLDNFESTSKVRDAVERFEQELSATPPVRPIDLEFLKPR